MIKKDIPITPEICSLYTPKIWGEILTILGFSIVTEVVQSFAS
jgi:hypothetical protein